MLAQKLVVVICTLVFAFAACGDGGPDLPTQEKDWLILFKRVTLSSDTPDSVEIELEVRTGTHLSQPAPDSTTLTLETSLGRFEGAGPVAKIPTAEGRALARLEIGGPGNINVTARVHQSETRLTIVVRPDGSLTVHAP